MRLVKLKLRNFRCYGAETDFSINDLTTIIGRNDIGKSTILEALDGFFNNNIDSSDLSTSAGTDPLEITCYFENLPTQLILDTSVPTSPTDEGILNLLNQLEVKKTYSFGAKKSTAVYLVCNYPSDLKAEDLLSLKNGPLKAKAAELGVNLDGVNKTKNPPIRQRIREFIGGGRTIKSIKVDGSLDTEDNLRTIWSSISKLLPVYSLFKVDKTLDDKDGDIKDPMQVAINEALAIPEIQQMLEQVEEAVRQASTEVADKTIEKLKDFDETLSERLKSAFTKPPSYSKIFDLTLLNENNIPLNKRGSGIRRLVLLSFFQAQAERRKLKENAPAIIYAIEEPETSQHPDHQKKLILSLISLSQQENVQVLFTTHNANLVRELPIESLRYISSSVQQGITIENGQNANGTANEEVIKKVIQTLGILPNPSDRIKVIVYVEGNYDVLALKRYSRTLHADNNDIIDLSAATNVGYVIAGGSSLKHYIEQKHLEGLGKPEVHIYDNDKAEYRDAVATINQEGNAFKFACNTSKLELENYLHHEAIIDAYGANGINNLVINPIEDQQDVPTVIAEKLYVAGGGNWATCSEEKRKELSSAKKKLLNTQAVELMSINRIKERDGYNEIVSWLNKIKEFSLA